MTDLPAEPTAPAPVQLSERGPLNTYEVTWMSGHVEHILGHQVIWRGGSAGLFSGSSTEPARMLIHGEINGHWTLQLSALESDVRTVRNLATELGGAS